jgi:polyisoprenoid-binding protein YceI
MPSLTRSSLLRTALFGTLLTLSSATVLAAPETYVLDTKGTHAFVQFKIKHLGYSWLLGQFNQFDGEFTLDKDAIETSRVKATIDVGSIDSNHAERDKHLRSADFLDTAKHPTATFVSTSVKRTSDTTADVTGNFTLKGITKPLTLKASYIGGGQDPWGGTRQGFELHGEFALKDYGITYNLGPASEIVQIYISAEGIKK